MPRKPKDDDGPRPTHAARGYESLLFWPGPKPQCSPTSKKRDRDRMAAKLEEWEIRELFCNAVHTNDPESRKDAANFVKLRLKEGLELRQVERNWLAWILERLIEKNQVPHMARGNTIKSHARYVLTVQLAEAMCKSEPGDVTKRLHDTANSLNVSFGTARSLYYSEMGQLWLEEFRKDSKKSQPK